MTLTARDVDLAEGIRGAARGADGRAGGRVAGACGRAQRARAGVPARAREARQRTRAAAGAHEAGGRRGVQHGEDQVRDRHTGEGRRGVQVRGEGEGRTGERGASRNEKTRKNGKKIEIERRHVTTATCDNNL